MSIAEVAPEMMNTLWVRGGFPSAFLAQDNDKAFDWIDNFVRTYIERELGVSKLRAAPMELALFLRVLSSMHGQLVNFAHLSQVLQLSVPTVKNHLQFFEHAFLIRTLQPFLNSNTATVRSSTKGIPRH